ncbi:MAG: hypothetical protein DRP87_09880 [Spirochaetes bacterium]|nr:MAG: hypothetical protein DRP87_09880 [Spirochaetota bacterium]
MGKNDILKKLPLQGFLKVTKERPSTLTAQQRTALVRKGNELFNQGEYEKAKRVFLTVGYADGISRIGDYYYKQKNYIEALKMYMLAPAPDKKDKVVEQLSSVVRKWLKEGVWEK